MERARPIAARQGLGSGFAAVGALLYFAMPAWGQTAPALPPPGSPLPGVESPSLPQAAPQPAPPPVAPGAVNPALAVAISDVSISGATAYPMSVLAPYLAGLTGPAVPVASIEAARTAIVNKYRRDGYVYTSVNARITAGHLRFVVTEGRIVSVKLDGNIGPAGTQVLSFLEPLTSISPLTTAALERALLLASDVPGVTVRGIINPSTEDPGALTLVAQVTRAPVTGQIQADNRAFHQTGPEEMLGVFDFNSFTSLGEMTQLSMYHTWNNTDTFGQLAEDFFLGNSGLRFHMYGGAGQADPSGSLRALGYQGFTRVFGGSLSYPIIRSRARTLTAAALFDGVESDISTSALGTRHRASFDSVRVARISLEDVSADTWLGAQFSASDYAMIRLSQGIPMLGASHNNSVQLPRVGEETDFTKVNGELDRTQTLLSITGAGTISVKLAAAGQYSDDILPPEEKFYLGGPHFDRGFYYGEITGDKAAAATFEPLFDAPLPKPGWFPLPLSAEFYGFYDWGEVWQNQRLELDHVLRSTGGGVRLYLGERVEMDFEGVDRLTRTPDGTPPEVPPLKAAAFYWQIIGRF